MRVVRDATGTDWICLELPARGDEPPGSCRMECNSGADRVEILIPAPWDDLPDGDFLGRIARAMAG
ncbi:MAG: hypothetical protein MUC69_08405 [Gemmatimonadales bacterium]|jgi:hypothetical protein|nr:hypothetical protein [Gemmatimonadales bacterium]